MKRLKYIFLLLCGVFTLWSCSNNELPDGSVGNISAQPFTITINNSGFRADNDIQTRVKDDGNQTTFTAGDKIGLFAVQDDELVEEIKNLCLTAVDDGLGGINWEVEGDKQLLRDVSYFAYFPYMESFPFLVDDYFYPWNEEALGFFYGLVEEMIPDTDQSTYDKYKSQDLMVGNGTFTNNVLSFAMEHARSLVVLDLPKTKSAGGEFIDAPNTHFLGFNPYRMDDGTYCFLISSVRGLVGGYTNADGVIVKWLIEPRLNYGYYHVYTVDGGSTNQIEPKP